MLSELLYVDDFVLLSEPIMGLRNKFMNWKLTYMCKGLKVSLVLANVVVSGSITKDDLT